MASDGKNFPRQIGRVIFVIVTFAALLVGALYGLPVQEDPRSQRLAGFLQGLLVASASFADRPVTVPVSSIPSTPMSLCTIYDYEGIEDLKAFLGDARFKELAETYRMQDRKSAIVFVYGASIVPMASDSLGPSTYFAVSRTVCLPANTSSLIVAGRQIELLRSR